MRIKQRHQL